MKSLQSLILGFCFVIFGFQAKAIEITALSVNTSTLRCSTFKQYTRALKKLESGQLTREEVSVIRRRIEQIDPQIFYTHAAIASIRLKTPALLVLSNNFILTETHEKLPILRLAIPGYVEKTHNVFELPFPGEISAQVRLSLLGFCAQFSGRQDRVEAEALNIIRNRLP
ncbi:MAG: hypothetical protein K2Q26_11985 [Bdellovibrionales bacterium]|nr:hypothetical protein [Bdellovibrionales bacterium]